MFNTPDIDLNTVVWPIPQAVESVNLEQVLAPPLPAALDQLKNPSHLCNSVSLLVKLGK